MPNKPLTYNRFRAYLRYKFIHQHWNKYFNVKTAILAFILYFLCSLTLFLLPYNILTLYPYLKVFTDFMDFIPAIKLMESKTFAPELCKFYAAYMFVVAFVCFIYFSKEIIRLSFIKLLRPNKNSNKAKKKILSEPKTFLLFIILFDTFAIYFYPAFFAGDTIGYSKYRSSDEYFIYNSFEMLYYCLWNMGFMFVVGFPFIIGSNLVYFDIFIHHWSKIQWLTKKKL